MLLYKPSNACPPRDVTDHVRQLHVPGPLVHLRGLRGGDSPVLRPRHPAVRDHPAQGALPGGGRVRRRIHQVRCTRLMISAVRTVYVTYQI